MSENRYITRADLDKLPTKADDIRNGVVRTIQLPTELVKRDDKAENKTA